MVFLLRALTFSRKFSGELSRKNEMDLSWECYLNYSLGSQYIFSLIWSILPFSRWKKKERKKKKFKKPKSMPFDIFRRGSFAVRVRDDLRSNLGIISGLGIICSAVHYLSLLGRKRSFWIFKEATYNEYLIWPDLNKTQTVFIRFWSMFNRLTTSDIHNFILCFLFHMPHRRT